MASAMITGTLWLLTGIGYVILLLALLLAWVTWRAVHKGLVAWTRRLERECLGMTILFGVWMPSNMWSLVTAPSVEYGYVLVTNAMTVWYFGRAWWKLHKDGPNNGRRRRRAKYALKRVGERLVPVPAGTPARG